MSVDGVIQQLHDENDAQESYVLIRELKIYLDVSDVSPHVVRHTVATRLLENGLNIQEVQHIMGHADQKTTSRYLHASTQMSAKRAAEILNRKTEKPKLKVVK